MSFFWIFFYYQYFIHQKLSIYALRDLKVHAAKLQINNFVAKLMAYFLSFLSFLLLYPIWIIQQKTYL